MGAYLVYVVDKGLGLASRKVSDDISLVRV